MIVYLVAFVFTLIFVRYAALYYNKIKAIKSNSGVSRMLNKEDNLSLLRKYRLYYILFFLFAIFPLFFVAAVRYDVGTDYFYTYVPNFLKILNGESPYTEWGFNQLNRFIQLFTDNPQWLFVVTSLIFTFVLIQTIVRYSSNVSISVIVVLLSCVFFVFLNNVRQLIAAVFFLRAFPYIKNRNFLKYVVCMLLGCVFHLSALVMILPYFIVNFKFIRKNFALIAVLATLLLPFFAQVMKVIIMNTKYKYFFDSEFNNGNVTVINIIYNLFFFIVSYTVLYKRLNVDKTAYVLIFMQFLAFLVSALSLFISISELISRFTTYFQIFQILLIPYCFTTLTNKTDKVIYLSGYILAYALYLIYFIILKGYHHVLPYHWIF